MFLALTIIQITGHVSIITASLSISPSSFYHPQYCIGNCKYYPQLSALHIHTTISNYISFKVLQKHDTAGMENSVLVKFPDEKRRIVLEDQNKKPGKKGNVFLLASVENLKMTMILRNQM